jgi:DNA-directed RNA polymerase specialized sigma54-like protein
MLRNTQGQILQQKLSPQSIQAQLLLAIPTLALDQEIKKQLEENPVLEEAVDSENEKSSEPEIKDVFSEENWAGNGQGAGYGSASSEERTEYLINKQNRVKESPLEQVYNLGLNSNELVIRLELLQGTFRNVLQFSWKNRNWQMLKTGNFAEK